MKNKKILKEFVKNILKEEQMLGLDFKTQVKDVNFYQIKDLFGSTESIFSDIVLDIEVTSSILTVEWSLDVDANYSGIKNMSPIIKRIYGTLEWTVPTEELTDSEKQFFLNKKGEIFGNEIIGEITIDIDSNNDEWKIQVNKDTDTTSYYPNNIDFYYFKKIIEVDF